MEVALLLGLAALGYALAPQIAAEQKKLRGEAGSSEKINPKETLLAGFYFCSYSALLRHLPSHLA